MRLSYCVVNTNAREHLVRCLNAIEAVHPADLEAEVLVLDNASDDGSADAVRAWMEAGGALANATRLIALDRRAGKAENDSRLLAEASGEYCLLLNEDTELQPGAVELLVEALHADPGAGAAGAQLLAPDGTAQPCAWRLPSLATAFAGALFLHRLFTVQGATDRTTEVGWVQSAAMLVRREAASAIGYLDPEFFVYSDETDFCKRLRDGGWTVLHVPGARAIHHEQLATDLARERRRIVEFHRGRDRYMRKHHGRLVAALARPLGAWPYVLRALAALVLPGHDPRRYLAHASAALMPMRGVGLREAAEAYNRGQRT
ncbi:MAG TPA: glycosyltransferase [Solirubrobacterales bacterium]|nr:glycosyltransferase [Solirubrobacterales bacterium]